MSSTGSKFSISPNTYANLTLVMLVLLAMIVFTGSLVRLTGSGLGCPDWPKCHGQLIAPADFNSQIEFGNRVFTGVIGFVAALVGVLAWLRTPRRRDLIVIGMLMPLGIVAEAALGAFTVLFDLRYGFVMAHFCLSMALLAAGVALAYRARHETSEQPADRDRTAQWLTRGLVALASVLIFVGTATTAAGPHPGSSGEQIERLDLIGSGTLEWLIHWHGRIGTLLGVSTVAVLIYLYRKGYRSTTLKALAVAAVLIAIQGVIGLIQYLNALPAAVVWLHIFVATLVWIAILWAALSVGRLERGATKSAVPAS